MVRARIEQDNTDFLIIDETNIFQIFRFCDVHVCTSHSGIPIGIDLYSLITSDTGYCQMLTVKEI